MGWKRVGRLITYEATCDHCGKTERIQADETDGGMDLMPPPWYGFLPPTAYYTESDPVTVCGHDCARDLVVDRVGKLIASREPGEPVAA